MNKDAEYRNSINLDLPIMDVTEDVLDRSSFVENLAQVIVEHNFETSFCIGLYGEWGSGKTSALNMLFNSVKEKDDTILTFKFNPWLSSDPKELTQQFLIQLSDNAELKLEKNNQFWKKLNKYAEALSFTKYIPIFGKYLDTGTELLKDIASVNSEKENDIQHLKEEVAKEIRSENIKLLITIDDIDRLSDCEIVAIFQLVKALADFPNTVYVLAFDVGVVSRALSGLQLGDGFSYLEKIVQLPVVIPSPDSEVLENYFLTKLEEIAGETVAENDLDSDEWGLLLNFGIYPYIRTIRDINRFANTFSIKYKLLKGRININDLVGITALQVFEPELYSKLHNLKGIIFDLLGTYALESAEDLIHQRKTSIDVLIVSCKSVKDKSAIESILALLFPQISECFDMKFNTRGYDGDRDFIGNRINVLPCYDRYFTLSISNNDIPYNELFYLLVQSEESEIKPLIQSYYECGRQRLLLKHIISFLRTGKSHYINGERAKALIIGLSTAGKYVEEDINHIFGKQSAPQLFSIAFSQLLRIIDTESRMACIEGIISNESTHINTSAIIINMLTSLCESAEKNNSESIIKNDELEVLKNSFSDCASQVLIKGDCIKEPNGLNFFWTYRRLKQELAIGQLKNLLKSDYNIAMFISSAANHYALSGKVYWTFDEERVSEIITSDKVKSAVDNYVKTEGFQNLSEYDKRNIMAYKLFVDGTGIEEDPFGDIGVSEGVINNALINLSR